jgi:hypothetical protein
LVLRRGAGAAAAVSFSDRGVTVPLDDGTTYAVAFATPGAGQSVGSGVQDTLDLPPGTGVLLVPADA